MIPNQWPTGCPWWSEEELRRGLTKHDTLVELGEEWGVDPTTLATWRDRHEIKVEEN